MVCEMQYGSNTITPGTYIRFKNTPGVFRFRGIVHQEDEDRILCVGQEGDYHAFSAARFMGPVMKRSRRFK